MKSITLKSRCDWQIEAKFTDGLYRINLLDLGNDSNSSSYNQIDKLKYDNSFIHRLIFI